MGWVEILVRVWCDPIEGGEDKVDGRGLNVLKNREDCNLLCATLKQSSRSEKKVYFIIVFHPVFYVLYMSIIVYPFDKLVFDNEALSCF